MLPILTFHAIDERPSLLSYPPRRFVRLLKGLRAAGWRCIPLDTVADWVRAAKPFPSRVFSITFDDGYQSVYTAAFPVLCELNLAATVFVTTGERTGANEHIRTMYGRVLLNLNELREMSRHVIAIGAHTLTHPNLTGLDQVSIERELRDSKAMLQDTLGVSVKSFAYPYGEYDARSRALAARYFDCACSDRLALARPHSDVYALERVDAFYLRADWASDLMTSPFFPSYVALRRLGRGLRRAVIGAPRRDPIVFAPGANA